MYLRFAAASLAVLLAPLQDKTSDPEADLKAAIQANIEKGFSYLIKPVADIPNFNSARDELAGAQVLGEYANGLYHAKDGLYEIYRKGGKIAVSTGDGGWLPYEQFVAPLKQAMKEAFDDGDGRYWRK